MPKMARRSAANGMKKRSPQSDIPEGFVVSEKGAACIYNGCAPILFLYSAAGAAVVTGTGGLQLGHAPRPRLCAWRTVSWRRFSWPLHMEVAW